MLCYPFEERRLTKWRPPYLLQPKLDGDRCRACVDSQGDVLLLSSEQNIFTSVPHINSALKNLHLRNVEFDGELYIHRAPHEVIHGIVSRTENLHHDFQLVEFHIFDLVNPLLQVERTNQLLDTIPLRGAGRNFGPLHIVPVRFVTTIEEIMQAQEEFAKRGYEGFVIRDSFAPYIRKRSTQMMKFKPRKEDLYEISGYSVEIDQYRRVKEGILGRLICASEAGLPFLGEWSPHTKLPEGYFGVGSGSLLTQDIRLRLWRDRGTLCGKYARVKYQHLTHARGVPRFPVIVEIVDPTNFGK
jgi:ATP-dependent DNA ligase